MKTLADRLRWVLEQRSWTQEAWSRAAGLSANYLATTLYRARRDKDYRPDFNTMKALAGAAEVDVMWLAEGTGEPRATTAPPRPQESPLAPAGVRVVKGDLSAPLRALLVAYRQSDVDPEDFEAVHQLVREGHGMMAGEEAGLVAGMLAWLRAARRLRKEGQPVNFETLAWYLVTHGNPAHLRALDERSDALNAEAHRELEDLGVTPLPAPVMPKRK